MTAPVVLAVDPGGVNVGIVGRQADHLLGHIAVTRPPGMPLPDWLHKVIGNVNAVDAAIDQARPLSRALDPVRLFAIEDHNDPTPHMGYARVRDQIETAYVVGRLLGWVAEQPYWRLVLVPPGGHGKQLLASYPPELVGKRERTGRGKSPRQHARAAWDIAGAAVTIDRMWNASRGGPAR